MLKRAAQTAILVSGSLAMSAAPVGGATFDKSHPLRLWHNVNTGGDWVDVVIRIQTPSPHVPCWGTAKLAGRTSHLRRLRTGKRDGRRWHFRLAPHTPSGRMKIRVTCRLADRHRVSAVRRFKVPASRAPRRDFQRLIARGSLTVEAWRPPQPHEGVGGGGTEYPFGQCTWYVHQHRRDLPVFAGKAGNAANWLKSARAVGLPTGTEPRVRAVAVFEPGEQGAGKFGHVALVIKVKETQIVIAEANFGSTPIGHRRTIPWAGLDFIYPPGDQDKPQPTPTPTATATTPGATPSPSPTPSPGPTPSPEPTATPAPTQAEYRCEHGAAADQYQLQQQGQSVATAFTASGARIVRGSVFIGRLGARGDGNPSRARVGVYTSPTDRGTPYRVAEAVVIAPPEAADVDFELEGSRPTTPGQQLWFAVTAIDGVFVYQQQDFSRPPAERCWLGSLDSVVS